MCGIFGISKRGGAISFEVLNRMGRVLAHRGPDDRGCVIFNRVGSGRWTCTGESYDNSPDLAVGLGHRRLSILDLSEAGHQPMANEDRTVWITYNGEVYNYIEIRKELKKIGHRFQSQTDTEVVIHAYEEWGFSCLHHFIGMWAFALWDKRNNRLFCARDRFGIKPFYYFLSHDHFFFASEIKAFLDRQILEPAPNDSRICDYLAYGYIDHTDETFFDGVRQLRGGHYLILDLENWCLTVSRYWDVEPKDPIRCKPDKACAEEFLDLFTDAVRLRLRSDVPVGTCLSGGLDSSSIVCVTSQLCGQRKLKTFSSCFEERQYDERPYIEAVARKTGVENYQVFPDPGTLSHDINKLLWHQDEPFASTSVYAQWNVFKLAESQQTKVILDGQGADEILGGYHPFFGDFLVELLTQGRLLAAFREMRSLRSLHSYSFKWILCHFIASFLRAKRVNLVSEFLPLHRRFVWLSNAKKMSPLIPQNQKFAKRPLLNRLYHLLTATSLPALLHYEDRNSMAYSIEARIPFLDHRLVEFVFSLPTEQILRNGRTKVVLREAMTDILPEKVRERVDKIGFVTPEDMWFETTLREWVKGIIRSESFQERGYLNPLRVEKELDLHNAGKKNVSSVIWRWVNLELWFRRFIDRTSVGPE